MPGRLDSQMHRHVGELPGMLSAYKSLSYSYKLQDNLDSAFFYQELAFSANDSLNGPEKISQFQNIVFDEQLKANELEKERVEKENRLTHLTFFLNLRRHQHPSSDLQCRIALQAIDETNYASKIYKRKHPGRNSGGITREHGRRI